MVETLTQPGGSEEEKPMPDRWQGLGLEIMHSTMKGLPPMFWATIVTGPGASRNSFAARL